ncbi:MAG: hypothetical protein GY928_00395 [Colwellia sp.]|nr:hypothetical protein [Colwellia sp.]
MALIYCNESIKWRGCNEAGDGKCGSTQWRFHNTKCDTQYQKDGKWMLMKQSIAALLQW